MPVYETPTTQNLYDRGNRLRQGQINFGNLQEVYGTGLAPTDQLSGNRGVVDVQSNIGTSRVGTAGSDVFAQANNPYLTQEQQALLKRQRGLAAAGGIFGGAVTAQQARTSQQYLAENKVGALEELSSSAFQGFNQMGGVAGDAFKLLGSAYNPAVATSFDVKEFRPLLQTLSDIGFGNEVNAFLAHEAGQLATVEGGNINQEVFGALSQFINPQLSDSQRSLLSKEAKRLPARFIAPGENVQSVYESRVRAREGQLLDRYLGQTRQQAAGGLTEIIGREFGNLNVSAQQLQAQHALATSALRRGDYSAVLGSSSDYANQLFRTTGVAATPQGAASTVNLNDIAAARRGASERYAPFLRPRVNRTFRSV